jgi:hypothetical protein
VGDRQDRAQVELLEQLGIPIAAGVLLFRGLLISGIVMLVSY